MYETIVFVSWGAVLFALVFEAVYRVRYFARLRRGRGDDRPAHRGQRADPRRLDRAAGPRAARQHVAHDARAHDHARLRGLHPGDGHGPPEPRASTSSRPGSAALLKTLSLFLYRALQVGTLFLAVGTMLGGVWASYSWGRFWGWDPKETWALIALLGYLAVLHGRFVGWIRDFGMAVGSLLGFLLVLMAWYGVNFVLGTGLHSYGFGSGGYGYVGGFVAFELLVIVARCCDAAPSPRTTREVAGRGAAAERRDARAGPLMRG